MTKVLKQRLLVRVLCLLLSLFLLVMPILTVQAEAFFAEAVATTYVYELVMTMMVGNGMAFANQDDGMSVSKSVFGWLQENGRAAALKFIDIANKVLSLAHPSPMGVRYSRDMLNDVRDALVSLGFDPAVSGDQTISVATQGSIGFSDDYVDYTVPIITDASGHVHQISVGDLYSDNGVWAIPFFYSVDGDLRRTVNYRSPYLVSGNPEASMKKYLDGNHWILRHAPNDKDITFTIGTIEYSGDSWSLWTAFGGFRTSGFTLDQQLYPISIGVSSDVIISGDLAYTGDQSLVLAPPLPTTTADPDTGKEIVVVPPISVKPGDWTADIPKTDTGDLVDVPTDTLVDATTGEIVGEGDIPDVNPPGTLPKPGDLTIPQLIITKFPFSIPFDLYKMLSVLVADPVEPVFKIPFNIPGVVNYEFVLDFSRFSSLIEIIRWGEYIVFLVGLAHATRNVIKW